MISDGTDIDFDSLTIEETIEAIDQHYSLCKGKYSRLSVEWGKWSRAMNVSSRKCLKDFDINNMKEIEESIRWLWLHAYWISRSRLLDFHLRNRILAQNKIKKELKKLKECRENILGKKCPSEIDKEQFIRKLIGKE